MITVLISFKKSFDQNVKSYAERFSGKFRYLSATKGSDTYIEVTQDKTHIGGAVYSAGVVLCRYLEKNQQSNPKFLAGKNVRTDLKRNIIFCYVLYVAFTFVLQVLELGGGTGVVGLCASLLMGAHVQTTDMYGTRFPISNNVRQL
jgi:hypothetical protein